MVTQVPSYSAKTAKRPSYPHPCHRGCLTNIAEQIYSLCRHSATIRKALMGCCSLGRKWAILEPASPVATFVVVFIRNTLHDEAGTHNYYQAINSRYPAAWQALKTLGAMGNLAMNYDMMVTPFADTALIELLDQSGEGFETTPMNPQVQDDNSLAIEALLSAILGALSIGKLDLFYTDSFKTVSRNYEKLLRTIEFCLCCEKPFVSANYFISNGHGEKRARLLRWRIGAKELLKNPV